MDQDTVDWTLKAISQIKISGNELRAVIIPEKSDMVAVCIKVRRRKFLLSSLKSHLGCLGYDLSQWVYNYAVPVKKSLGRDIMLFFSVPKTYWDSIQSSPGVKFNFGASGLTSFRLASRQVVAEAGGKRIVGLD